MMATLFGIVVGTLIGVLATLAALGIAPH